MIPVSVPLIFPKVIPNDWEIWNNVWEQNKKFVPKSLQTKNIEQVYWVGFDIYVKPGINPNDIMPYTCKNVNCPELFPSLFDNIDKLPIEVHLVRVLQSLGRVHAHHDYAKETEYNSIRSLLIDNNPKQTWWYEDSNTNKHYLKLPEDTNTGWYDDAKVKHATDFYIGHKKQLIMYQGLIKDCLQSVLEDSKQKYSDYVIYV
jgi:hypothetical protein